MQKKIIALVMVCTLSALFAGCTSTGNNAFREETLSDKNWGRSVETAKFNQTLHPEAGKSLEPVEGLNGVSSDNTVNKYQESFKEKRQKENTDTLNIQ